MKKHIFTLSVFLLVLSASQSFGIGFPHNLLAPNKHEKKEKVSKNKSASLRSKKVLSNKENSKLITMKDKVFLWFSCKEA